MADTYQLDEFYTALEVAEIKGITKQAVVAGCQSNKYPGAIKTQPDRSNRQGLWLIPKSVIDSPVKVNAIANVTHKLTPGEMQNIVRETIREEVRSIFREEMAQFSEGTKRYMEKIIEYQAGELMGYMEKQTEIIGSRLERNKKPWWKLWGN